MRNSGWMIRGAVAAACGVVAACLFSCEVGPNYQRPAMDVPTTFKSEVVTTQTAATMENVHAGALAPDWWRLFDDPELNRLEWLAVEGNQTIRAAIARVLEARAAARISQSYFLPTVTADPSFTRTRTSANVSRGSATVVTTPGGTGGTGSSGNRSRTASQYQIPFDLTYEVDVWGRVRRTYEASKAQLQASADDFQVVLQTLEADVAQDYFNLRSLDAQDKILVESVQSYRDQVSLTATQQRAGLVGGVDISQAEALLDATITQEIDIRRQRADMEHALAILLGRPPLGVTLGVAPLTGEPPVIPVGLPMELLRRRPDVAEAEQNLAAASADVGVATANFYPVFTIAGSAGLESFDLQHIVDWQSRFWDLGPNVSIPIFEGGRLKAGLEQAKEQFNEFAATYRQQVLTAFQDVEDSLTDLHLRADEAKAQQVAVAASREYLRLSNVQYKSGLVPYLTVIDADRTLLNNELSEAQILNQRMVSTVLLMKALGGGWDSQNPAASQPAIPHYDPVAATRP